MSEEPARKRLRMMLQGSKEGDGALELGELLKSFQREHGFPVKDIEPALGLLQELHITRSEAFRSVIAPALSDALVQELKHADEAVVHQLLDKSSPYFFSERTELFPVPIAAMERVDIPASLMTKLCQSAPRNKPYVDLPLQVKRKIWEADKTTFFSEINDDVTNYVFSRHHLSYFANQFIFDKLREPQEDVEEKRRKRNSCLQHMVQMIGANIKLYRYCCIYIHDQVSKGYEPGYSNLRCDLIYGIAEGPSYPSGVEALEKHYKAYVIIRDSFKVGSIGHEEVEELFDIVSSLFVQKTSPLVFKDISLLLSSGPALVTLTSYLIQALWVHEGTKLTTNKDLERIVYLIWVGLDLGNIFKHGAFDTSATQLLAMNQTHLQSVLAIHREDLNRADQDDSELVKPLQRMLAMVQDHRFFRRLIMSHIFQVYIERGNPIWIYRLRPIITMVLKTADPIYERRELILSEFFHKVLNLEMRQWYAEEAVVDQVERLLN
mmetsp:Transcript_16450/g.33564  ORF Transcript_16450/g.33564 Transcript_16450/m.33564 type:complete len:493 (-) Transcript_16450:92-1570(-)